MDLTDVTTCSGCGALVERRNSTTHRRWHDQIDRQLRSMLDRLGDDLRGQMRGTKSRVDHILAWLEHHGIEININEFPEGYNLSHEELERIKREADQPESAGPG